MHSANALWIERKPAKRLTRWPSLSPMS